VDYVPWPEIGCSLAEARKRTAEQACGRDWQAESKLIDEEFEVHCIELLRSGRLIGYGRPGTSNAGQQSISMTQWKSFSRIEWESSTAADDRPGGNSFFNVCVYPPLLAPCHTDLLTGLTLLEAFKQLVLGDAEVALLGRKAVQLSPDFAAAFVNGRCEIHGVEEWPLAFDRWAMLSTVHPDPAKQSIYDGAGDPDPIEVVIAAEALKHRYRALISKLQRGEIEGRGLPAAPGYLDVIPRSIWSHEEFHFDARTGDVFQDNPESTGRHDRLIRRWIGVMLQRPNLPDRPMQLAGMMFHGKPPVHDRSPSGTPESQQASPTQSKAVTRVEAKTTSVHACEAWLKGMISDSPNQRTRSIDELWEEAKQKWPKTLSRRKFLDAREAAIASTPGASAWAVGGRPRKPQHPNRRTD
jgi:hypothetical protein